MYPYLTTVAHTVIHRVFSLNNNLTIKNHLYKCKIKQTKILTRNTAASLINLAVEN